MGLKVPIELIYPSDKIGEVVKKANSNFILFASEDFKGDQGDPGIGIPGATGVGVKGDTGNEGSQLKFTSSALTNGAAAGAGHVEDDIILDGNGSFFKVTEQSPNNYVYTFQYTIPSAATNDYITNKDDYDNSGLNSVNKWILKTQSGQNLRDLFIAKRTQGTPNDTSELYRMVVGADEYTSAKEVSVSIVNIIPDAGYTGSDPFAQMEFNYRANNTSNISANNTRLIFEEDGGSPPNALFSLVNGVNKIRMTQKGVNPTTTNTIESFAPINVWQDDEAAGSPAKLTMTLDQSGDEVVFTSPNKVRFDLTNFLYAGSDSFFKSASYAVGGGSSVTSTIWQGVGAVPLVIESTNNIQVGTSGASNHLYLTSGSSGQIHAQSENIYLGSSALSNPTLLTPATKSLTITGSTGFTMNTTSGQGLIAPDEDLIMRSVTEDVLIKTTAVQRKLELKVEPEIQIGLPADDIYFLKMESYSTDYHADTEIATDGLLVSGLFSRARLGRVFDDGSSLYQYYVDGNSNDAIEVYRQYTNTLVLMEQPPNGTSIYGVKFNGVPTSWFGSNSSTYSVAGTVKAFSLRIINLSGVSLALVGQATATVDPDIPFWIGSAGSGNIIMTNGSIVELVYVNTDDGVLTNNHSKKYHVVSEHLN